MTTKEERPWPQRPPPDASAGFNMFIGHRPSLENNESSSVGSSRASSIQGVVHGDGNEDRMWSNRLASADFNIYNNIRNSMGTDEYTSFGVPMNQGGSTGPVDGGSVPSHIFGRRPLDPLLTPRSQPNSLIIDGGVPLSARRGSPLQISTINQTPISNLFTSSSARSPPLVPRRRASAPPVPSHPNNLSRIGSFLPHVPSSPNTSPWHGRSSGDPNPLNQWLPSPSDQHRNSSTGYYALGTPSYQAPMWSVASSNGASLDNANARPSNYGFNNFATDPGQLLQSHIPALPNRRHTFPNEFSGPSEMMRDFGAMNYSRSVPVSPAVHWSSGPSFGRMEHSTSPPGIFGRFETNYGSFAGDAGNFEVTPTGISGTRLLEDAVRDQHFERVVALLEQGFSPNGERGSSQTPPLLIAVSCGNERLVKLLLDTGANVDGYDSRQYTALHYAAASGYLGIVNILLGAGANIYAKTDDDLLPVQLATEPTTLEYLSVRMKSDMEDRISPKQAKFASAGPNLRFPSFQRSTSADQDSMELANSRSLGYSEAGGAGKIMDEAINRNVLPGVAVNIGFGYQDREPLGTAQSFREGSNRQLGFGGPDRQSSLNFASQAVGPRLMDWEAPKNLPSEPNQSFVQRALFNQSPSEWNNSGFNQNMDVWMQDGTGHSQGSSMRPLFEQVLPEKPLLQRSPSAPVVPWQELNACQANLLSQSSDSSSQQSCSPKLALPRVSSAPSALGHDVVDVQRYRLQKSDPLLQAISTEAQAVVGDKSKKIEGGSSRKNLLDETEVSMISDNSDEEDSEDEDPNELGTFKKFARACDSVAPSMIEKFRASSGQSLDVNEIEAFSEKVSTTPQAPETPRQVGESQGKTDIRVTDSSQKASSSLQKGKSNSAGVIPASVLKAEMTKVKERKRSERKVTFALAESIREEDLALIREDWHEAARSGCVGCGKPGCGGQCLVPKKSSSGSACDVASCSSSSSETEPKDTYPAPKSSRIGSVRWTRGELLGEGAYGKVFAGLNQDTGELMAVKQLKLDTTAEGQERQFYLAALEREIAFYKTMRHKHIVGYIDMEQDLETGSLYVFLEYVSGGSIQSMLERFGRFSEPLVKVYTRQLLLGLEYLHGKKIVHRDIKGGNVLVDADGVIKLADFGASKAFHDPTQTDGFKSIRGSVFWMAPEVIKGDGYGRRADIWSVGCTVVEMLTAVHPWPGMDNTWTAIFHIAKASSGPPIPEGVSSVAEDFLNLCFQLDPKNRPTSTELLLHPFVADSSAGRETS